MPAWITRRFLIVLGIGGFLLGAYALGGFLGVPRLLRSQAQQFVHEKYSRELALGEIRFNPFTLALEVRDLALPDADGTPLLAFRRLLVNLDVASLWRRGLSFADIELEAPDTHVVIRADGSVNLADLGKPFVPKPGEPEPPPGDPLRLFIDRFAISTGQSSFEDRSRASPFRAQLTPISFELRNFSTTEKTGNEYELRGQSQQGEAFEWRGSFALNPLSSRGRFALHSVQARTLWSYLRDSLGFEIASGVLGLAGDYEFAALPTVLELKSSIDRVALTDLGIRPRDGMADYVHLDQLQVGATRLDLAARSLVVGKVALQGAQVNAWRDAQGRINLQELLRPPAATATPVVSSSGRERPWAVSIPDISLTALHAALEDRTLMPAAAFTLAPIDVRVTGFSTAPGSSLDIDVSVGINGTGKLMTQTKLTPDTGALAGRVELVALDLTAAQPYLDRSTGLNLVSGLLATRLQIARAATGVLQVQGDVEVTKLRTVDKALRQDFIKWEALRIAGIDWRSAPAHLRIAKVTARAPYARVVIAQDQTVNVAKVLSAPATAPVPTPTSLRAASAPLPVTVGMVRITNGSANLADFWIQPNYAVSLQGLDGSIDGLSSDPKSRARLVLDGKVDRYAPTHIEGEINLLSASLYSDVRLNFKGVELTSVTPYAGRFAGYRIEKGKLSVDLQYHVDNRVLKADNRFVIDQLQLGERVESPDAVKLPLKIAIALLKDRNGVIDVGLPITGSLDDPQFRIGPIIWKAVLNLLTKIVTAPFALLGNLFGGGAEMNLVEFEPGTATLDAVGQEKLASLMKALTERPQLQLDVPMAYSRALDGKALAAQRLDAALVTRAQGSSRKPVDTAPLLADPEKRYGLLLAQYRADFGRDGGLPPGAQAIEGAKLRKSDTAAFTTANAELESALQAKQPVSDAELETLGKRRASAVQDALLVGGEVDAARVFIIGRAADAVDAQGARVRLEMSLK